MLYLIKKERIMGTFINPGNDNLRMDRNDSIYVDKSLLISNLNKVVCGRERFFMYFPPNTIW